MNSEAGSTSHGTSGALFDVFLSFRGRDTRINFTDSLYHALLDKGLRVFRDKPEIEVGDEFGTEIFEAIDDSIIGIPIFSKGYASSSWCLRELKHMMERRKMKKLEVMPIFYDVDPFDVKLGTEVYKDALTQKEERHGAEVVQRWREALEEVTTITGWEAKGKGHGELTRQIASDVSYKLKVSPVHLSDHLVGIDKSVDEVIDLLSVESKDIRLVGICGIGGIGKTTLADVIFKMLKANFQSCSYIPYIRHTAESATSGLLDLQTKLVRDILGDERIVISSIGQGENMMQERFSQMKVLIFLDDVSDGRQLRALAARREWFGSGSRILVTTRDKNVLSAFENSLTYEVQGLNSQESLELFSKHAFGSNSPPSDFLSLSEKATAKAGGLPLIIEVIGSLLRGQEKAVWEDIVKKMEKIPPKDVLKNLELSYNALHGTQREIFLDIACFLAGENKRDATYMWDDCELFPYEGIQALLSKSLIKIGVENELWMHDLLKDLGRNAVLAENKKNPGMRSRVWNHKEALDMFTRKKGTEIVEAICVDFDGISLTSEEFKQVPNVRFLEMICENLSGDFEDLFPELRWLSWKNCPSNLQATNFFPEQLLILNLSRTGITQHWNGWIQLKVATRLKVLNLSFCWRLDTTPYLSTYLSLEFLILEDCRNLVSIDKSIGHLRRLKHLNLKRCFHLQVLPVELRSLEALTELLIEQSTDWDISIREVPSSIGALLNLECLVIRKAIKLTTLPNSFEMLKSLGELDVSGTKITELPTTILHLKSLKVLKINKTCMQKLPESIGMLEKLEEIYGEGCRQLEMIPSDIVRLSFLKILKLTKTCVQNVPKLPQSLVSLCLSSNATDKAPEISNLVRLRNLELCFNSSLSIEYFPSVRTYSPCCMLELPRITSISSYLGCLCCLRELELRECYNLCQIGQLPSTLRKLTICYCDCLEAVDLSNLENLLDLTLHGNFEIQGLEGLTSLQFLKVLCLKLSEFSGLERLKNLRLLVIFRCLLLQTLPNLSNFKNLKDILLRDCPRFMALTNWNHYEVLPSKAAVPCQAYLIHPTRRSWRSATSIFIRQFRTEKTRGWKR